jgi:hypothetical protein
MWKQVHLAWAGFELTTLVVKGTDCIGSYKSNHYTIMATTSPELILIRLTAITWAGQWFSPGTQVSSTNKTYSHHITEILLKVALNTITLTLKIRSLTGEPLLHTANQSD